MPAHEEIKALNETVPQKIRAAGLSETWSRERLLNDSLHRYENYDAFRGTSEGKKWEADISNLFTNMDNRWEQEEKKSLPDLYAKDRTMNRWGSFTDTGARDIHNELTYHFDDRHFAPTHLWDLPGDDQTKKQWQTLVNSAKQQVQRNATDLASVVRTVRTMAGKELESAKGKPAADQWRDSDVFKTLQALENRLNEWDGIAHSEPFPDRQLLKDAAKKCNEQIKAFNEKFNPEYLKSDTLPFIKYQLLATMKAVTEKVDSQFASRAGEPSLSAMYERMCDVPKSDSILGAGEKAEQFLTNEMLTFKNDRGKNWEKTLQQVGGDFKKVDNEAGKALSAEMSKLNLTGSIKRWSEANKKLGFDPMAALQDMHQAASEIAFGLQKYKAAVERVVMQSKSPKDLEGAKNTFTSLFDGIAVVHQREILFCQRYFQ